MSSDRLFVEVEKLRGFGTRAWRWNESSQSPSPSHPVDPNLRLDRSFPGPEDFLVARLEKNPDKGLRLPGELSGILLSSRLSVLIMQFEIVVLLPFLWDLKRDPSGLLLWLGPERSKWLESVGDWEIHPAPKSMSDKFS